MLYEQLVFKKWRTKWKWYCYWIWKLVYYCVFDTVHMKKRFMKLLNRMFLKHRTSKMLQYTLEATLLYHCWTMSNSVKRQMWMYYNLISMQIHKIYLKTFLCKEQQQQKIQLLKSADKDDHDVKMVQFFCFEFHIFYLNMNHFKRLLVLRYW